MTEEDRRLLAVLDVRVHDLLALCEERRMRIEELEKSLAAKEEELSIALETVRNLNNKCDNLLMARVVSVQEGELRNAKLRLSKLVREIDKCIALLNE